MQFKLHLLAELLNGIILHIQMAKTLKDAPLPVLKGLRKIYDTSH